MPDIRVETHQIKSVRTLEVKNEKNNWTGWENNYISDTLIYDRKPFDNFLFYRQ